jgi:phosphatidylglycerol:prolipoprotein diacylglycerol transferase
VYPLLFQIGALKLYTYGLMMAVGFFAAIQWGMRRASRYNVSEDFISNLSWIMVIGGVLGGRLGYFLFEQSPADIFSLRFLEFQKGGMVFYGGFIVAVIGSYIYSRKHGIPFLTVADIMGPPIALGHAFGRLGCLMAGCCYGKHCELPWAITFHHPMSLAPLNIPIHPTQIYESLGLFAIAGALHLFQKRQKFMGQMFAMYLALYAILRTTVELYRGDEDRGYVTLWGMYPNEWLSTSTAIGAGMLAVALAIYLKYRKTASP